MRLLVSWARPDRRRVTAGRTGPRLVAEAGALAATVTVLAVLVVVKAVTRPAWRASARSGVAECLNGRGPDRTADRLHQVGRLGCVLARLEPVRTDYLELAVALLLVGLLVGEVRLLARDREIRRLRGVPARPAPGGTGPEQPGGRRPSGPRTGPQAPVADPADRPGRSDGP